MQVDVKDTTTNVITTLETWYNNFTASLPNILVATVVVVIAYFMSTYINKWVTKLVSRQVSKVSIANIIGKIAAVTVVLSGLFIALGVLNLSDTLKSLLTGAGIAGAVIGLALQGTLANTIAGVVISFRKRIQIGNWIETNGFAGEVVDINLKEFTLKEADNNIVVIPNKMILESPLKNYSLTTKMRVTLECGVGYESNLESVEKITRETLAQSFSQIENANEVEFYYTEFGGSSINFITRFWIDAENSLEKLRAKSTAIAKIKQAFDKEDINIPFPIRTLQFDNKLSIEDMAQKAAYAKN